MLDCLEVIIINIEENEKISRFLFLKISCLVKQDMIF